jgi:CRP-like cAMP-binding protein
MGIEKTLKRAEVFLGLDDGDICEIAALPSCREQVYQPGDIIFSAGEEAQYVYVLKEGEVDLMIQVPPKSQQPAKVIIDRVTTGGLFGWSALVKPQFYTMSAVCEKPAKAVVIGGSELKALFERDNHIGYKVLQGLSHVIGLRLRGMEQVLMKGQRHPPFFEK